MTREDRKNEIQDYVAYLDQLREHLSRGASARLRVVVLVRGDTDAVLTDARLRAEEEARVSEGGIELRLVTYPGGHEIDVGVLGMLTDASP